MTDIFATLGPACAQPSITEEMLQAGMTGVRLNLNHGRLSDTMPLLSRAREAARSLGTELKLLADLQGSSLRLGCLKAPIALNPGKTVLLGEKGLPVPEYLLAESCNPECFSFCDGTILLETLEKREDCYLCRVIRGGTLESKKGFTVSGAEIHLPVLTREDEESVCLMRESGIYAVMVPFVTGKEQLIKIREVLDRHDCGHIKIWAKLENRAGFMNLNEWLPYADMCVIARGDLGNNYPLECIPALQKHIATECKKAGTPFLVATGLLRSLMFEERPSRADISDIYNAILDGAAGLMLTDETARGSRPVLSVKYLADTARTAGRGICDILQNLP